MQPVASSDDALTPPELQRYSRHLTLPHVGLAGQARLKRARILLVGAGGLGSPATLYLAAAGVGHLGVVDSDTVDTSNLQRQVLHGTEDVGRKKVDSAREQIASVNPFVHVETYDTRLTSANAMEILRGYDVVVDGTDNFQTRYLTNDACVLLGIPNVYGSVLRFEGQASVFATPDAPCYRCLFREPPPPGAVPTCEEGGVLGVLPGLVGTIQAAEAIKLVLGAGETLAGRLLLVDALRMSFRTIALRRDPACPACGTREIRDLIDYDAFCGLTPAGPARDAAGADASNGELHGGLHGPLTPRALAARLAAGDDLQLVDVREPYEHRIARLDGARLVPLRTLPQSLGTLDPQLETVVLCHHGIRSASAAEFMRQQGFRNVRNLEGGIEAWSVDVDGAVPRY